MKRLILCLALVAGPLFAAEGETYTTKVENGFTKYEALKKLLASDNKTAIFKCVLVEASSKGTIKNK